MSKSLYDELVGEQKVDIECPHCGKNISLRINQIGTTVRCPHCSNFIKLKDENGGFAKAKKATGDLEKTLKKFGK